MKVEVDTILGDEDDVGRPCAQLGGGVERGRHRDRRDVMDLGLGLGRLVYRRPFVGFLEIRSAPEEAAGTGCVRTGGVGTWMPGTSMGEPRTERPRTSPASARNENVVCQSSMAVETKKESVCRSREPCRTLRNACHPETRDVSDHRRHFPRTCFQGDNPENGRQST